MRTNCIVVGAGASGLMAAYELSKAGRTVILLEARNRTGGRICTMTKGNFSSPIEAGAEFIHGDLPLTQALLKAAGVRWAAMEGKSYRVEKGKLSTRDLFENEWDDLLQKLNALTADMTLQEFLAENFPHEKYAALHVNIRRFVEGYNAADISKVSALGLKKEWGAEEDPVQYRPRGGYATILRFLEHELSKYRVVINLSQVVKKIQWKKNHVRVQTDHATFEADTLLITTPLSVVNKIAFLPDIPNHLEAVKEIGFGSVIKFIFEFKSRFWEESSPRPLSDLRFLFSDAPIPTWWSQLPDQRPLLTGWLGGPAADEMPDDQNKLFSLGIKSLAYVTSRTPEFIRQHLVEWHIANWHTDPFSEGAYSYPMLKSQEARKVFQTPLLNTLFWAGEALYEGPHTGTVEAALTSGLTTAQSILSKTPCLTEPT
jgi:monoamine oxidase